MAETTEKAKKAKAPAKPRAAAGTKKAAEKTDGTAAVDGAAAGAKTTVYVPTHDEIAFLALQYWEQRGRAHGDHVRDWLRAEQDLMKMAS